LSDTTSKFCFVAIIVNLHNFLYCIFRPRHVYDFSLKQIHVLMNSGVTAALKMHKTDGNAFKQTALQTRVESIFVTLGGVYITPHGVPLTFFTSGFK
jgi:hypothetical protein